MVCYYLYFLYCYFIQQFQILRSDLIYQYSLEWWQCVKLKEGTVKASVDYFTFCPSTGELKRKFPHFISYPAGSYSLQRTQRYLGEPHIEQQLPCGKTVLAFQIYEGKIILERNGKGKPRITVLNKYIYQIYNISVFLTIVL